MNDSMPNDRSNINKGERKQKGCIERILQRKQKGCGFRLHFCMDNKKKSQIKGGNMRHEIAGSSNNKITGSTKKSLLTISTPPPNSTCIRNTANRRNVNLPGYNQSNDMLSSQDKSEVKVKEEPKNPTMQRQSIIRVGKKSPGCISLKDNSNNEIAQSGQKIQFSSQERHIDTMEPEKALRIKKVPNEYKHLSLDLQDEATSKKSNRRKSTMKRGTLYSLTSLPRQTLTSSMNSLAISQILSKLCMIEDRITNLEKIGKHQDNIKNIVGVSSCKGRKVELKNMDENGESSTTPIPFKSNTTVVIKVCRDDVVVDTVEGSGKKKPSMQWRGSNLLVYQNTENLDTLSMEKLPLSKSVQSATKKPIVKVYSQTTGPMKKQSSQIGKEFHKN